MHLLSGERIDADAPPFALARVLLQRERSAFTGDPAMTRSRLFIPPLILPLLVLGSPAFADAPKLDRGDTAWMLTSTALVLMMTVPGLALFYAGMVRKMNLLNTMAQSFGVTCLVTVLWMVIGYSLAFTGSGSFVGSLDRFFLHGMAIGGANPLAPTIPESVYMCFQMTFA